MTSYLSVNPTTTFHATNSLRWKIIKNVPVLTLNLQQFDQIRKIAVVLYMRGSQSVVMTTTYFLFVVEVFKCNFTFDFCGLKQADNDNPPPQSWYRGYKTITSQTGPVFDHTIGHKGDRNLNVCRLNFSTLVHMLPFAPKLSQVMIFIYLLGMFAFIHLKPRKKKGYYTDLLIPVDLLGTGSVTYCMSFWYFLFGRDIGWIQVLLRNVNKDNLVFNATKTGS